VCGKVEIHKVRKEYAIVILFKVPSATVPSHTIPTVVTPRKPISFAKPTDIITPVSPVSVRGC
jgi:hypothetical protein